MRHYFEFGEFRVDVMKRVLLRNGRLVRLSPKVFDTLLIFVQNPGLVLEKDELMRLIWGETNVEENNLAQNVFTLRKALNEEAGQHRYIVTIPGQGYQFGEEVKEISDSVQGPQDLNRNDGSGSRNGKALPIAVVDSSSINTDELTPPRKHLYRFATVLALLLVAAIGGYLFWLQQRSASADAEVAATSIAVLPFATLNAENADQSLEIGIADALITKLGNVKKITVRPTSAILKYSGSGRDALSAGSQLKVDAVLDGQIQKSGETIRVSAQLLRVSDGKSLWAGSFEEKFADIFDLQNSIARQIARTLVPELTPAKDDPFTRQDTNNIEAYEFYIRGRYFWNKRTAEGLKASIALFERSVQLDPNYAQAYAGLLNSYALSGFYNYLSPRESWPKAQAAAIDALRLDDSIAEAYAVLALVKDNYELDWAGAEQLYQRAIELDPGHPTTRQWYAWHLLGGGKKDEAFAQLSRAQELDPTSLSISGAIATFFYFTRDYDRAIEQSRNTLKVDSNFVRARLTLGLAYEGKGELKEAIEEFQKARELSDQGGESLGALGHALARSGKQSEALKIIQELSEARDGQPKSSFDMAIIYLALGDFRKGRQLLDEGRADRTTWWARLRLDPRLENKAPDQ